MKIGILTFHRAVNYGASLQAYALKKYIEKQKLDVEIVDYRCKYIEDLYNNPFSKGNSFKGKLKNILTWKIQKKRNEKFDIFIKEYLKCEEKTSLFNKNDLKEKEKELDKIIVGSDQVWSTFCTNNDTSYYLDFVENNAKKFSYAASFGIAKEEYSNNESLKKLISDFSGVSVREKVAYDLLKKVNGIESSVCLDPTFLLEKSEWEQLTRTVNEEKYILVYSLSMPEAIVKYAEKMAKEKNIKVIYFTLNNLFSLKKQNNVITGSPLDFISYLSNAEYVITNSFHGTAFSLIFNKDFTVLKNANKNHDNSRLENILSIAGTEERMITEGEMIFFDKKINYNIVNKNIKNELEKSKEYLRKILN